MFAGAVSSPDGGEQDSQLRAGVATSRATPTNAAGVRPSPPSGGMMARFATSLVNSCRMRFLVAAKRGFWVTTRPSAELTAALIRHEDNFATLGLTHEGPFAGGITQ